MAGTTPLRTLTLGRREDAPTQSPQVFRVMLARTLAQDIWMSRVVRMAGLDQVRVPSGAADDTKVFEAFLTALVEKIFEADLVGDLLAGVLVPERSAHWTTAGAAETKTFILNLTDDEEKKTLLHLLAEILQHFLSGDRSS
jgi:hypothetical protein